MLGSEKEPKKTKDESTTNVGVIAVVIEFINPFGVSNHAIKREQDKAVLIKVMRYRWTLGPLEPDNEAGT